MTTTSNRIPPQNLDAERALLGSLLLKPDAIHDIASNIKKDSFYTQRHKLIFNTMLDLASRGEPIDLLSITTRLSDQNLLEQAGGRSYVAELATATPSPNNISHYADLVSRKYTMRSLIDVAYRITEHSYDETRDTAELLDEAEKLVYAVGDTASSHSFISIAEKLPDTWDRIERLSKQENTIRGVPTGFANIDEMLSGLHPSDLVILAARPSVGKTAFALDIARNTAVRYGTAVGIFSLEMSSEQLIDRMLAAESSVNSWKLRTGNIHDETDFDRIRDALESLSKAPIFIDDKPGNNILSMRAVARRLKREHDVKLIIVDYLQLMSPVGSKASDSLVQQVTEISRSLKGLARELNIPVLALSQLSRAVEQRGGKPRLSDLRDSGSIEQDADVVMFIHRDDKQNPNSERPNIAEILIEKHRNGPTGKVELYFDEKRTTFMPVDKSGYGDLASEF